MHLAFAITYAVITTTVQTTAYTPSPEACRLARMNCFDPVRPLMATGLPPFVGAAACSYDFPLGTVIEFQDSVTVTVDGHSFTLPQEVICLDRFGRPTRNRRVDIVLLLPEDPGRTELALARAWGARSLTAVVRFPDERWQPPPTAFLWPPPATAPRPDFLGE